MRLLLLGGIGEALQCAEKLTLKLAGTEHTLIYSLLGKGRKPQLDCAARVGGFGGVAGLIEYIGLNRINLLIDMTHPYAEQISNHAKAAAKASGIPLWAYRRPPWPDKWLVNCFQYTDWSQLVGLLKCYRAPFFSIGQTPFEHIDDIPKHQHWCIRCLQKPQPEVTSKTQQYTVLESIGPFDLEQEINVFQTGKIDVLVTKNSGGSSVSAKLEAALQLNIPVCVLKRPHLPTAQREFDNIAALSREILYHCQLL